jgi:hypothetical protein
MRKILRYPIPVGTEHLVSMRKRAVIRHVGMQREPTIWAEVDLEQEMEQRKFKVLGIGDIIDEGAVYVGTCLDGSYYVWHIYEV